MAFTFTPENKQKVDDLLPRYETKQAALLPILHIAQEQNGYVSTEVEETVAASSSRPLPA